MILWWWMSSIDSPVVLAKWVWYQSIRYL